VSIKRKVARVRIKVRKIQREKERKDLKQLAMDRNKALKSADIAVKKATIKEQSRQAQLKEMKAKGISPKKGVVKSRTKKAIKTNQKIIKGMKSFQKFVRKHSR